MSFYIYDITFFVVFSLFVIIFLYKRRKKLKREGIIYLYRTSLGIKIIDYIGTRYKKILYFLEYIIITAGYILMAGMLFLLFQLVYYFVKYPSFVKAIKIPPVAPLIPYLPEIFKIQFLPPFYFTYWIIILAVVAIFHEFSHGIFSRLHKIKIKSTGFFFLGPFFGAFVEPDEKKLQKIKNKNQMAMLGAGSFANIILALIFFCLFWIFFILTLTPSGVMFDSYTYSIINNTDITSIGKNISVNLDGGLNLTEVKVFNKTYFIDTEIIGNLSEYKQIIAFEDSPAINVGLSGIIIKVNNDKIRNNDELRAEILKNKPGDEIEITTLVNDAEKKYNLVLGKNPENESQSYLGIAQIPYQSTFLGKIRAVLTFFKDDNTYYAPKFAPDFILFVYNFFWWMILINISVALTNMLPIGIFDGGRVFYLTALSITKSEKLSKKIVLGATYLILFIFALLMVFWFLSFF